MSLRNIITLLVATSLLATAVAPGAAACADPHCPWSPVTQPIRELVDDCTPLGDCIYLVGEVGRIVTELVCTYIGC